MTSTQPVQPTAKATPCVSGSGVTWHHVKAITVEDLDFISALFPVNRFDLADAVSQRRLPTVVNRKDYLFAILHFPRFIQAKQTVAPRQVGVFLNDKALVTIYQSELKPLDNLFLSCQNNANTRNEFLGESSAVLLYRILDTLVDYLFPILDKVLEALERVEDDVFDERKSEAGRVNILRRDIVDQRRILFPMAKLINEIRVKSKQWSLTDLDLHYEDLHDKATKIWDTLESARERIEIFKDADFVLSTEKTNRILAVLTILFTLTIPATAIGTLYGMNISLPGGIQTGVWTFLGTYTTFWVVLIASAVTAAVMMQQ
jgi:magnesium transporter